MQTSDFDTLACPTCSEAVEPGSVSRGPTVAYRCACGTSWRINRDGEQTHLRYREATIQFIMDRIRASVVVES